MGIFNKAMNRVSEHIDNLRAMKSEDHARLALRSEGLKEAGEKGMSFSYSKLGMMANAITGANSSNTMKGIGIGAATMGLGNSLISDDGSTMGNIARGAISGAALGAAGLGVLRYGTAHKNKLKDMVALTS